MYVRINSLRPYQELGTIKLENICTQKLWLHENFCFQLYISVAVPKTVLRYNSHATIILLPFMRWSSSKLFFIGTFCMSV